MNTYTGATAVNAGTLLVNGSTASGSAVTVASGATLGGNGTVGGSVTLNGILVPGNSIGTLSIGGDLTWNTSGSLLTELGTAGVSIASFGTSNQVAITGNFNKGTGATFAFDFGGTGELGWYRLANWGGTTTFTDTDFTATNLGGGLGATFQIDSGALYLNVIPEPSTYALVALGLGGLLALRRRQRQGKSIPLAREVKSDGVGAPSLPLHDCVVGPSRVSNLTRKLALRGAFCTLSRCARLEFGAQRR